MWLNLRLRCFLFFFVFSLRFLGCGRRRETRFVFFCVAPQVACRQRSHAQIATSVLQSLFCTHSTWRRCCNIKSQGGVFRTHSRWRRLLLWLRPSTGDTLRLLPRRAVGRLQTEISPADCDFSLALVVLHTFDMASLALQHQKVRGSFSHWRQEAPVCLNWQLCFFTLVFCFRFLAGSKAGERRPQSRPTSRPGLLSACCPPLRGQLAALVLMRSRDFSLALAVLHTFDVGVARAATSKGQGVFHSVALKGCCVLELATLFFCALVF